LAQFTAFLDACVLYPAPLRDLLLELAVSGLFRAKWTTAIQVEWVEALLRERSDLSREALMRTGARMNLALPDALVDGYDGLAASLHLPDPDDRHVLAAAIKARADIIVTSNLRDFPEAALAPWSIEAQHPDVFLANLFHLAPPRFLAAVKTVRDRLRNPPKTTTEYLETLRRQGLLATVAELEPYSGLI
jgi:hypothetical protein